MLEDLVLAARAEAALIGTMPTVKVSCKEGRLYSAVSAPLSREARIIREAHELLSNIDGIKETKIIVDPMFIED